MHTLAVRPSKRLILLYGLLYSLSLILVTIYGKSWPGFIFLSVIISISCAGIMSLYSLCALKALTWLPQGKIELQFRTGMKHYDQITVCHQGPKLIILHCENPQKQRYVLCLADAFTADDFGLLQRLLRVQGYEIPGIFQHVDPSTADSQLFVNGLKVEVDKQGLWIDGQRVVNGIIQPMSQIIVESESNPSSSLTFFPSLEANEDGAHLLSKKDEKKGCCCAVM